MFQPLNEKAVHALHENVRRIRQDLVLCVMNDLPFETGESFARALDIYAQKRDIIGRRVNRRGLLQVARRGEDYVREVSSRLKMSFNVIGLHEQGREIAEVLSHIKRPEWDKSVGAIFGDCARLYYPLAPTTIPDEQIQVERALMDLGYTEIYYADGYAIDQHKRNFKIGKILHKHKCDQSLVNGYVNDVRRAFRKGVRSDDQLVVLSRYPYDIMRMSMGRKWQSCARTNGPGDGPKYMRESLLEGRLIGYLIKKSDPNIYDPLARCFLNPNAVFGENGISWQRMQKVYHNEKTDEAVQSGAFKDTLNRIACDLNGGKEPIPYHL